MARLKNSNLSCPQTQDPSYADLWATTLEPGAGTFPDYPDNDYRQNYELLPASPQSIQSGQNHLRPFFPETKSNRLPNPTAVPRYDSHFAFYAFHTSST